MEQKRIVKRIPNPQYCGCQNGDEAKIGSTSKEQQERQWLFDMLSDEQKREVEFVNEIVKQSTNHRFIHNNKRVFFTCIWKGAVGGDEILKSNVGK